MKWNVPIYSAYYAGSETFLKALNADADGIRFVDMPSIHQLLDDNGSTIYDRFISQYPTQQSVDYIFALAYNSFIALYQAISTGGDVRNELYKGKFKGVTGEFSFDRNGDIMGITHVMKEVKHGRPIVIE